MRYLDEVTFIKESPDSHYDPDLGEWVEKELTRAVFSANITDIGTDRSAKVFGDIKQGAKVMRMMPLFNMPEYDYIEFDNKKWALMTYRNPSERNTFILHSTQSMPPTLGSSLSQEAAPATNWCATSTLRRAGSGEQ